MSAVGRSVLRLDGRAKVLGQYAYAMDIALPGMLWGRIARSPHAHARIRGIDPSVALQVPGVVAVVTARDAPARRFGGLVKDETIFAVDVARYVGQPVAAVAATSREAADDAVDRLAVDYEVLPAITDPDRAAAEDAALVHEAWESYAAHPQVIRSGNVCGEAWIVKGDWDRALGEADAVYEDTFTTAPVHQAYLEPRAALAVWETPDRLVVYSNTQLPFEIQQTLADAFGLSPGQIRVVVTGIGGAFGGKLRVGVEHIAALLAQRARRPVKVALTMDEEFVAAYPRHGMRIRLRTAVRRDGTIVGKEATALLDAGAYSGSSPGLPSVATLVLAGPYRIPHLRLVARAVYTHKQNFGSYRAPMGPQCAFAVESQMDMIARRLGLDPLEFRLRNIVRDGDAGPTGQVFGRSSMEAVLRRAAEAIGWGQPSGPYRGKGLACGWWTTTGGPSGVYVKLQPDGSATLLTGCAEIGTGALTGAVQVLAAELGLEVDRISVVSADTFATPYDHGAQGSRTAFGVGNAARQAAAELRRQILDVAAGALEAHPRDLVLRDGHVAVAGAPARRLSLAEVARLGLQRGGLIAAGAFAAPPTPYDASCVRGHVYPAFHSPSFHAHAAEVAVDPETGEVRVLRYVAVQDVGFAINPQLIEGQIEGGVVQGLGQALWEELRYQDGQPLVHNLSDYAVPRVTDVPPIEVVTVAWPSEVGPYGAKGVGEPPIIEPPAAVANALDAAAGARVTSLPITAPRVHAALRGTRRTV
ncbi:MAG: xanthine dehydrogenase family protein molybdopterin-binding subunit [Armatimonadota bacterium]|nr:xanthine dehydrogenase family protein molybdopterin-binding subunit [Armatimonadota bacterium]MDR7533910.1 xanthine dehydrogenase family protein molybdopterin-binding subunit [Armatimonadota bacterium]MDR7536077.1 xanthine dehydrogenase family protein molybdopterin-binding subunit [Armatimonadota bacterium]